MAVISISRQPRELGVLPAIHPGDSVAYLGRISIFATLDLCRLPPFGAEVYEELRPR